jgi:adenylate cyclase
MAATRRLAAILAADVAGYSRLIGSDEQGTLQRLKAIRAELADPAIAAHHGRIVKATGDGLLAEFASTVDALRCAGEIQTKMAERNFALARDARIRRRSLCSSRRSGSVLVIRSSDCDISGSASSI